MGDERMLCPFCGKELRNLKRCPKCHRQQRAKWRGVTDPDFLEKLIADHEEKTKNSEIQKLTPNEEIPAEEKKVESSGDWKNFFATIFGKSGN